MACGPGLDPDGEVADVEGVERVGRRDLERVLREVANRRQHAGHHVGVLHRGAAGLHVLEQQAAPALDEERLLDAVDERLEQDDFGERLAGADRLDPPAEGSRRHRQLERAVERFDHAGEAGGDGLADGRAHHREQRVGERLRVALDGLR